MNHLREQIERAKTAYVAQHYPGDLATELLPIAVGYEPAYKQRRFRRTPRELIPWVLAAGLGSLAAAIVILINLSGLLSRPSADSVLIDTLIAQSEPADLALPAMPEMPSNVPVVPEYQVFSLPSMPSFPSPMEADASQQNGPTTQETIL
ncbi:MAG: hypothetical protein ACM359_24420 [Bacillota bacterium]